MSRPSLPVVLALSVLAWAVVEAPSQTSPLRTQVRFAGPPGMQVRWYVAGLDGKGGYSDRSVVAPARVNFRPGSTYRLRLSHIRGFPGLVLYPSLEVRHAGPGARQFLAHSAVPLELTDEDFRQVVNGQLVVKTVHLPGAGGADTPLLVLRMGNRDLEGS